MKNSTFETRTKSVSRNSKGFQLAEQLLTSGGTIRTCWTSGRGRFTTNMDYHQDTMDTLCFAGLRKWTDYVEANDSPKGGKTGQHIFLTPKGKRKMIVN